LPETRSARSLSSESEQSVKLRTVIQALQRENYARKFKVPPDNLGDRNLRMPCLNLECDGKASANFGRSNDYRQGLYNCPDCGLRGDALDLIIALAGEDLDPYDEMTDTEVAAMAHVWAETYAGAECATKVDRMESHTIPDDADESAYVPSWER
jgi:hypothetical protein